MRNISTLAKLWVVVAAQGMKAFTPENLKEHIAMLESDLAYALEILEELENGK